jgi:nucleoside-diphosphate-sugar epimerase
MAHWLVTGGAGFIGSHLAQTLLGRGERVRVADNLSTGRRSNLDVLGKDAEILIGDLADPAFARDTVAGVDYVLHQAAIPSVPRSVADPLTSHRANLDATVALLVAARDADVRRVVYAGSSSAYGDTPVLPKREDMAPDPLSPYALQKLVGEQYLQMFTRLYGLDTVTIRYFNVFGPRQDPSSPYSGVIALFVSCMLRGEAPSIVGDGEQTRDFTYVDNVVDGVLRAATAPAAAGHVILHQPARRLAAAAARRRRHARARAATTGRRARFACRHQQGTRSARLSADRHLRRRPAPYSGLVSEPGQLSPGRLGHATGVSPEMAVSARARQRPLTSTTGPARRVDLGAPSRV